MLVPTIILNGGKVLSLETFYNQIDLLFNRNECPSTGHFLEFFIQPHQIEPNIKG